MKTGLLSAAEAADRLGVAKQTLAVWRLRGGCGLRHVKLGARVLYDPADVATFIESNKRESTSDVGTSRDHG